MLLAVELLVDLVGDPPHLRVAHLPAVDEDELAIPTASAFPICTGAHVAGEPKEWRYG